MRSPFGTSARPRCPLAATGEVVLRRNAGWNVDGDGALTLDPALAAADFAWRPDHGPFAAAGGTRPDLHELAEHRPGGAAHFAGAVAGAARDRLGPARRTAAAAGRATGHRLDADAAPRAESHVLQRQADRHADVLSAPGVVARHAAAEDPLEPAEVAHEDVERLGEIDVRKAGAEPARPRRRRTEAVVVGALVGVGKHLVGLGNLLEAGFRFRRGIPIGMKLHREAAIGLLDVVARRLHLDTQHFVEIAHCSNPSIRRPVCSTRPMILS